jgi:hypothetical protein
MRPALPVSLTSPRTLVSTLPQRWENAPRPLSKLSNMGLSVWPPEAGGVEPGEVAPPSVKLKFAVPLDISAFAAPPTDAPL